MDSGFGTGKIQDDYRASCDASKWEVLKTGDGRWGLLKLAQEPTGGVERENDNTVLHYNPKETINSCEPVPI